MFFFTYLKKNIKILLQQKFRQLNDAYPSKKYKEKTNCDTKLQYVTKQAISSQNKVSEHNKYKFKQ